MKRFFCNTCQREKRVRHLPANVIPVKDDNGRIIAYSKGDCDYHNSSTSRTEYQNRRRRVLGIGSTSRMSASAARSKSKKG